MFENIISTINWAIGTGESEFSLMHMCTRALIVYIFGFLVIRLDKQLMGIRSPFNLILTVMMGSILANAITFHEVRFFSALGMCSILVLVNKISMHFAYHFNSLEKLLKGSPVLLVENGKIKWEAMRYNAITKEDLLSAMRQEAGHHDLAHVDKAFLENGGFITFVLKEGHK